MSNPEYKFENVGVTEGTKNNSNVNPLRIAAGTNT